MHSVDLDKTNNNNKYDDAVDVEMDKINEMESFINNESKDVPEAYKKIIVHVVFHVKYDVTREPDL